MAKKPREQIFNISVENQCSLCVHGDASDLFDCEWLCDKRCDEMLYPTPGGTEDCPHFNPYP